MDSVYSLSREREEKQLCVLDNHDWVYVFLFWSGKTLIEGKVVLLNIPQTKDHAINIWEVTI